MIREWELKIEKEFNIELANPFYDRDGEGGREDIAAWDQGLKPQKDDDYEFKLVQKDIGLIGTCDGVVAIVDGNLSYGTIMEMVYGNILKKPVFIICTNKSNDHPWFVYHGTKIYNSFDEFEKDINYVSETVKKLNI
ncbi:MAG: hypothetical protein Q7S74_03555 [Nanoarchaeota archaeon]|nr:hypothetical protein [Nanoarchaeota archaeon]